MQVNVKVNGSIIREDVPDDQLLIDFLRNHGFYSVKRGCETSNCGLCSVWLDEKPVLSCSVLTVRADQKAVTTLEGLEKEARVFAEYMANQGAEQCGFCSPGLIMNVLAMEKEMKEYTEEDIRRYLAGNLCRCSGYMSQMRAIQQYLARDKGETYESN